MTCVSWYSWCFVLNANQVDTALMTQKKQEQISCLNDKKSFDY